MKNYFLITVLLAGLCSCQEGSDLKRETDFNFNWKFTLQNNVSSDEIPIPNEDWSDIRLPHDWSVEASFDSTLEGCTGYLPGGTGWYQKHFSIPSQSRDKIVYLLFDGVYNNAEYWLNGESLGVHPYGYSPFYYEITSLLTDDGEENILTVRVDRTRYADSRWYTGSGIYRNVKLVTVDKLHIPVWGTFITTPEISADKANVQLEIKVMNAHKEGMPFDLETVILDAGGVKVAEQNDQLNLGPVEDQAFKQSLMVPDPALWDTEHPHMYAAVTSIIHKGEVIDKYVTPFGIRTIRFDPDNGFFLNGKNTLIKGVCLHHDGGLVGAAVPKGVWKRRLEKLREGGCNAIRIAHNPASDEFLDLCDELGFLVQDEFFDEFDFPKDKRTNTWEKYVDYITRGYTEHFQEWAERDLKNTMLSHRNHPSIIQWSIGNEIEWTYPRYKHATGFFDMDWTGNYFWSPPPIPPDIIKKRYEESPAGAYVLAETARKLADWTREVDTSRPVIANCILPSASHVTGYIDALDMAGYSYRRVLYDYGHELYPDKPIMGTENLGQWHEWKAVIERPFIAGLFLWTGINYLGEANNGWPEKGSNSGLLDLGGFAKPSWHLYRTLWDEEPHVFVSTQTADKSIFRVDEDGAVVEEKPGAWETRIWGWHRVNEHWNYSAPEHIIVEVITNCPEVELFLNDKSLGIKKLADFEDRIMKWAVSYEGGSLEARGTKEGKTVIDRLHTHGTPANILLEADRKRITADGYDVAHLVAQLCDADGRPVLTEDRKVEFIVDGECRILGVDNGAVDNVQDFQSNKLVTSKGRCMLVIQSLTADGSVKITAKSGDIESDPLILTIN